jgi:hypothetical protein
VADHRVIGLAGALDLMQRSGQPSSCAHEAAMADQINVIRRSAVPVSAIIVDIKGGASSI